MWGRNHLEWRLDKYLLICNLIHGWGTDTVYTAEKLKGHSDIGYFGGQKDGGKTLDNDSACSIGTGYDYSAEQLLPVFRAHKHSEFFSMYIVKACEIDWVAWKASQQNKYIIIYFDEIKVISLNMKNWRVKFERGFWEYPEYNYRIIMMECSFISTLN